MRQRLFDDKYVGYHTFGLGLNYVNVDDNQGSDDIHLDDPTEIDDGDNGGGKDPGRSA
jgi:hypothetical protein